MLFLSLSECFPVVSLPNVADVPRLRSNALVTFELRGEAPIKMACHVSCVLLFLLGNDDPNRWLVVFHVFFQLRDVFCFACFI